MNLLRGLFTAHASSDHIPSDNGLEFIAAGLRRWLDQSEALGLCTLPPGSPWENDYAASFNSRPRAGYPGCEMFDDVHSNQALGTAWRVSSNDDRLHALLDHPTPLSSRGRALLSLRLRLPLSPRSSKPRSYNPDFDSLASHQINTIPLIRGGCCSLQSLIKAYRCVLTRIDATG